MNRDELNRVYKILDTKAHEFAALFMSGHREVPCTYGYYNGHYHKNSAGDYVMDYFPIPVIEVKGVCDIELDLDRISISVKLKREAALKYDYEKLSPYKFESFGVEEYLEDFYVEGNTYADLIKNIEVSGECEIGFAFEFPMEAEAKGLLGFVEFLQREGFYY